MHFTLRLLAFVVLSVFSLAFSVSGKTKVREVNIAGRYSMMIPEYLTETNDLNDEASLQYENINKEVYIIVIDESTQTFVEMYEDSDTYDTTKSPLENYAALQMTSVREVMKTISYESKQRKLATGSGTALVYDMNATQEGIANEMGFTVAFIQGRLNLYFIMTWTFSKSKRNYQQDMDNMIISFKELSGDIAATAEPTVSSPVQIKVPDYMSVSTEYPDAIQCYESSFHTLTIAVFSDSLSTWDSIHASQVSAGQSMLDLYTTNLFNEAKSHLKNVDSLSSVEKRTINGLDARIFTLYGQPMNKDSVMYYKFCCIQGKHAMYAVQMWVTPEQRVLVEPVMEMAIQSFIEN